jgi:hypothetical protein
LEEPEKAAMIVYHTGVFREGPRVPDLFGERERNVMLTYAEIHDNLCQTKKWFMRIFKSRMRRK